MTKHLAALIIAALSASLSTPIAHAADSGPYLGLALAGAGKIDTRSRTGAQVDSDHSGFSGRLYGGYRLNRTFALEAGYVANATHTLDNVGPGSTGNARVKPSSVYAAVKTSYAVNDSVDLFGKLAVVHTRIDLAGLGADDVSIDRVRLGAGAEYRLTPQLGVTLEVQRYGSATVPHLGRLNFNRLEAGVNVRF